MELSLNLPAIYTKSCTQTFAPIFGLFAIFDRNFAKFVAPHSDEYENYIVLLKDQSLVKKSWKPPRNRPINGNAMLVWTMHPLNSMCSGRWTWQTKKTVTNTTFFPPTAGARCTIFPKLCMVIELVEAIKKAGIHFSIQRIVFPTGCTEKFGLIDPPTCDFSAITP